LTLRSNALLLFFFKYIRVPSVIRIYSQTPQFSNTRGGSFEGGDYIVTQVKRIPPNLTYTTDTVMSNTEQLPANFLVFLNQQTTKQK